MRLMVLDQASKNTGYSIWQINGETAVLEQYGLIRMSNNYEVPNRFFPLINQIDNFNSDEIVLEEVWGGKNYKTTKLLIQLQYHIIMHSYQKDIKWHIVHPNSWKATIKSEFKINKWKGKKMSITIGKEILGIEEVDFCDNQSEAVLIGIHFLKKEKGVKNINYSSCRRKLYF